MPDLWMPGATKLDIGDHAATDGGPAKAIAHITWDRNATAAKPADLVPYENLRSYFAGGGSRASPRTSCGTPSRGTSRSSCPPTPAARASSTRPAGPAPTGPAAS
jgi:hypothetical protein